MAVVYSAVERFDQGCGEAWRKFIAWSGLTQLQEVITLDGNLCPTIFQDLTAKDWEHNVQEDYKITLFRDLEHVLSKVAGNGQVNVLALLQNPTDDEVRSVTDYRFRFRGFDLVELQTGISALVNCGGFAKAFSRADLSECGLLTDHTQALRVQRLLQSEYPDEPHADCDIWAIWQMNTVPKTLGEQP
jgi:hypothetical protein